MPDFGRWGANGGDPSLNDIHRADQFLDALAGQQPVYATDREDAELAQLLGGWRDDIRLTQVGTVLSLDDAAAALTRTTSPGRRRRLSLAVVGSAAAAVLCLGGFGAVVAGSGPGDALYGMRTMFFGDQGPSVRDDAVILAAQTEMQQVAQLIEQGDWDGAKAKLEAVTTTVATVGDVESKEELVTQWQELTVKVDAQDPGATAAPGAPLPTFPEVPVVVLDPDSPSVTAPSETATSETTATTEPTETAEPSPTTEPGETTGPAETTAPPETTAPAETTAPSQTTSAAPASPSTSTSVAAPTSAAPAPTSTVVEQSSSVRSAPSPTASSVPSPTPSSAPSPPATTTSTTAAVASPTPQPTAAPSTTLAEQEAVPSPTSAVVPTTTTTVVPEE